MSSARIRPGWMLYDSIDSMHGARLCTHSRLQDAIIPQVIFALVRSLRTVCETKNKTCCRTEIPVVGLKCILQTAEEKGTTLRHHEPRVISTMFTQSEAF